MSKIGNDLSKPMPLLPLRLISVLYQMRFYKLNLFKFSSNFLSSEEIFKACSSFSNWQGPAIKVKGISLPISKLEFLLYDFSLFI